MCKFENVKIWKFENGFPNIAFIIKARVEGLRDFGPAISPFNSFLLLQGVETLSLRVERTVENALKVAKYLENHPKVEKVYYLGLIPEGTEEYSIYKKQYTSPGAMVSFDVKGGEEQAFRLLNSLKLIKLAVSLGGTESLAEHPATMTHAGVDPHHREEMHITEKLIRLSIGVENYNDIIWDLEQALQQV